MKESFQNGLIPMGRLEDRAPVTELTPISLSSQNTNGATYQISTTRKHIDKIMAASITANRGERRTICDNVIS